VLPLFALEASHCVCEDKTSGLLLLPPDSEQRSLAGSPDLILPPHTQVETSLSSFPPGAGPPALDPQPSTLNHKPWKQKN